MEKCLKKLFLDESGVTCYKVKDKDDFFALAGLFCDDSNILNELDKKLEPFKKNGEIKYKDNKKDISLLNKIIDIINGSGLKYHVEICQPYIYYITLLIDYLIYPYWIFDVGSEKNKKIFFTAFQEDFEIISLDEIRDFLLCDGIEDYKVKGKKILRKVISQTSKKELKNILEDAIEDFVLTDKYFKFCNSDINKLKPIPDVIGKKKKNLDILFIPHIQCLYQFFNKYQDYKFIHDNNFRLEDYINEILKKDYPNIVFQFADSKSEKGLIIIDFIVSYYKHCFEDIQKGSSSLRFNPISYNLVVSQVAMKKISNFLYSTPNI